MAKKILKIAILLPEFNVGGAERLIIEELKCFKNDSRFKFEIHAVFQAGPLYKEFKETGVSIHVWNAPHHSSKMLLTYLRITNYLRQNQFDILHCHLLNYTGPLIGRLAGIKRVITTIHNDRKFGLLERFSLHGNHIVIACGEQVANNIGKFISKRRIRIVPNAIAIPQQDKNHNYLNGYNISNRIILMSVGSLERQKGFDVLIRGLYEVKKKYPDILLFIAGEGKNRNFLEKIISELKLLDCVYLLGNVENIHSILPFVDIYINSSRWEGLPMTLIEAMAHGLPMVATDVGGNGEVVIDGKTGFLVQPENHSNISRAICRLVEDLSLRKKLGNEAFKLFQKNYKIDKHCFVLSGIYCC